MMNRPCCWQFGCGCSACQEDLYEYAASFGLEPFPTVAPASQPTDGDSAINQFNDLEHFRDQEQNYDDELGGSTVSVNATEDIESSDTTKTQGNPIAATQGPSQERRSYENSDPSFESSERPLLELSSLTTNQGLANPDPHDQHLTEYTALPARQTIDAEPKASTCGPQRTRIEPPLIAYLPSGHLGIICPFPECSGQKYGRLYDYERHYNGAHAENPTVFWCDVVGCGRSEAEGGHPFPRKDKRNDHKRKMHGM